MGKWEELSLNGISGHPIKLNGIILRKEITKVHVGVLGREPTDLVSFYRRNKGRAELDVVHLYRRIHYG